MDSNKSVTATFNLVGCQVDTECDDGLFCNGAETCGTDGTCQTASDPCPDQACDEVNDVCVAGPTAQLEYGTVTAGGNKMTVNFANTYVSPVVVCSVQYNNNSTPVVARVGNVTSSSFDLFLQNPDDGPVEIENISYLVVEEGTWTINGVNIEAQTYLSTVTDENNSWVGETQSYEQAYTNPVVLGQVMSVNDPSWSVFWAQGSSRSNPPSATALTTGKTVCEDTDTTRADETVGFIVFESGHGTIGGVEFEALVGPDTVRGVTDSPPYSYTFTTPFISAPQVAITTMAAVDGGNGGWAYVHGPTLATTTSLYLSIDEDQINDSERNHTTEQVGFVVFGPTTNNKTPVANDDLADTNEDTSLAIYVLANDTDADGDTLTVNSVTQGSNGATVTNNGSDVTYTPGSNFNGTDTFNYIVSDGNITDTALVTVSVIAINDPPMANEDPAGTTEDMPVTIDVLANDMDVDGDALSVFSATQGSYGTTEINNGSDVTYTPGSNFTGTDTFTYTVSDGNGSVDTATVTVFVSSLNHSPTGITLSKNEVQENAYGADIGQLTVTDSDTGDTHTFDVSDGRCEVVDNKLKLKSGQSLDCEAQSSFTLEVTATDPGGLSVTETFTVTVLDVNEAPTAMISTTPGDTPLTVDFDATGSSDPENGIASYAWDFGDGSTSSIDKTSHTYSTATTYTVKLTVTDEGNLTDEATTTVTVGATVDLEVRVSASYDDAEESQSGSVSRTSSDLELVRTSSNQTVGMRFNGATIPQGAAITNAYIQFQVDETDSEATSLAIQGQNIGNAPSFSSSSGNISSRAKTTASVSWEPVPWTQTGQAGPAQQTPDIARVIQEIVNRLDWFEGNSLVIIITGTGKRVAESYNGSNSGAPLLHVEYNTGPVANRAPSVDAGANQTVTLPNNSVILHGIVTDDLLPNPPGVVTTTWSKDSGPAGTVTFDNPNAVDTTARFPTSGTYELLLKADDGELTNSDVLTVTVYEEGTQPNTIEIRVEADYDDAEESQSGSIRRSSTDLELVYDGSNQKVGMRFNGATIPQGATITNAYIQFQAEETHSGATSLTIQGQDIGNAPTFSSSSGNISSRARTEASVSWDPVPWTRTGEAGPDQQTPDIASVIQEIVSRSDWSSGNSLVIIITGTGERAAESYDGRPSGAPLLHVEYSISGAAP